jgi:ankyrin repeat protein
MILKHLDQAADAGHEFIVGKYLQLMRGDPWFPRLVKRRLMYKAVNKGHEALVQTLLEFGADVKVADGKGNTPLHIAAHYGHEAVVKTLLEAPGGCDVNMAKDNGATPLFIAARFWSFGLCNW